MTVLTSEQLSRLRQRPHSTKLNLAVYQPNTVLAAQINMPSIERGEREITITVISGDVFSVRRGMTCYIGSTPNGRDKGRLRAIGCTATTLTLAENDETLRDGLYLTVVHFYEPWAVYPRIVLNDNNVPQFYKDYDIEYTNQNEQFDPVVNMGPHHAVWLDGTPTGSFAQVYYSSTGTYDPSDNSIPTGYLWIFDGGMPTASFVKDPGYITYTGGGHYTTHLTVTSNFGKEFTGHRHIMVLTEPEDGVFPPIKAWGMSSYDGSRDSGGYAIRLWIREEADYSKISDGALIIIYSDDREGTFEGKAGGNAENRSSIFFVGYIEDGSVSLNAYTNRLEFRAASVTGIMKNLASFSATLEDVDDAETWNEMTDMTVDKAMAHYLRWHTSILSIADFSPTGDTKPVEYMDFERSNTYDAVNNLYLSALMATVVADRQGKMWAEIDVNVLPTGSTRAIDTAMEVTRQDWRGSLDIQFRPNERLSYLEMGGIAYSGFETGTSDPYLAGAPGDAPAYFGGLNRVSGLVLEGQEQLNQFVGNAFARENAEFPELTIPMAGDYRLIDIAPQERLLLTLEASENYRGFSWQLKPFIPHTVRYTYQGQRQIAMMDVTAREETDGPPGEKVEIPVDPPFDTFDLPDWELPPFTLPPIPVFPPLEPPPVTGDLVYFAYENKIARCRNFFSAPSGTNWEVVMDKSLIADLNNIHGLVLDPSDPLNTALVWGPGSGGGYRVYKTNNLNDTTPTWTRTLDSTDWNDLVGGTGGNIQQIKPWINGRLWSMVGVGIGNLKGCNVGINCPWHGQSTDGGLTWTRYTISPSTNYGVPLVIQPTTYAGGQAWAGGQFRIWKTINAGQSWALDFLDTPQTTLPLPFPHPENSAAQIMFMTYEEIPIPENFELYWTQNGGSTWEEYDDSFSYGGEPHWSPTSFGSIFGNREDNFWIHPITGIGYGMFMSQQTNYAIFCAITASGLTFRAKFQDDNFMWSGHETDDDLHYAGGPGVLDPYIIGSDDGGFTWYDRVGDFESTVQSLATIGTLVSINPVGVV